jgi:hypothetical protein
MGVCGLFFGGRADGWGLWGRGGSRLCRLFKEPRHRSLRRSCGGGGEDGEPLYDAEEGKRERLVEVEETVGRASVSGEIGYEKENE